MAERSLLLDAVDSLLERECTFDVVAAAERSGWAEGLWGLLDELEMTAIGLPEELGGPGGDLDDPWSVVELAGRYALPVPLAEHGLLAGFALAGAGLQMPGGLTVLPSDAGVSPSLETTPAGPMLDGELGVVPWGSQARSVATLATDAGGNEHLVVARAEDLEAIPGSNVAGEPRDRLVARSISIGDGLHARVEAGLGARIRRRGALVRSRQIVGSIQRVLSLSVAHAVQRTQFGRPLIRFQAVQHHLAAIVRELTLARAAVESACRREARGGAGEAVVAVAKVRAGHAARTVAESAHQLHGAIGITSEYELQAHTRRLLAWRAEFGDETEWAVALGERALGGSSRAVWPLIAQTTDEEEAERHG